MQRDSRGLAISTASPTVAAALDRAVMGYLKVRADTPAQLGALLAADPDFGMAHCLKGYLALLAFKQANVTIAAEAARSAHRLAGGATARERAHVAALDAWIAGDLDRALAVWEQI